MLEETTLASAKLPPRRILESVHVRVFEQSDRISSIVKRLDEQADKIYGATPASPTPVPADTAATWGEVNLVQESLTSLEMSIKALERVIDRFDGIL